MGSRRKARELALQALYQIDMARVSPEAAVASVCRGVRLDDDTRLFLERLVYGAAENRETLDRKIEAGSENWSLYRMAVVDRNILRLALYEILFCTDIPAAVSINEAVEIAKRFGDANSPAFVNGILDRLARAENKL